MMMMMVMVMMVVVVVTVGWRLMCFVGFVAEPVSNASCGACAVERVCNAGNGTMVGGGSVVSADCGAGQTVIIDVLEMRSLYVQGVVGRGWGVDTHLHLHT